MSRVHVRFLEDPDEERNYSMVGTEKTYTLGRNEKLVVNGCKILGPCTVVVRCFPDGVAGYSVLRYELG